jgi:hypothetical protein
VAQWLEQWLTGMDARPGPIAEGHPEPQAAVRREARRWSTIDLRRVPRSRRRHPRPSHVPQVRTGARTCIARLRRRAGHRTGQVTVSRSRATSWPAAPAPWSPQGRRPVRARWPGPLPCRRPGRGRRRSRVLRRGRTARPPCGPPGPPKPGVGPARLIVAGPCGVASTARSTGTESVPESTASGTKVSDSRIRRQVQLLDSTAACSPVSASATRPCPGEVNRVQVLGGPVGQALGCERCASGQQEARCLRQVEEDPGDLDLERGQRACTWFAAGAGLLARP